jgi:hypothetical protein
MKLLIKLSPILVTSSLLDPSILLDVLFLKLLNLRSSLTARDKRLHSHETCRLIQVIYRRVTGFNGVQYSLK